MHGVQALWQRLRNSLRGAGKRQVFDETTTQPLLSPDRRQVCVSRQEVLPARHHPTPPLRSCEGEEDEEKPRHGQSSQKLHSCGGREMWLAQQYSPAYRVCRVQLAVAEVGGGEEEDERKGVRGGGLAVFAPPRWRAAFVLRTEQMQPRRRRSRGQFCILVPGLACEFASTLFVCWGVIVGIVEPTWDLVDNTSDMKMHELSHFFIFLSI